MGGSDDVEFYGGHLICESVVERNARRIVACVNLCAGISTEELEAPDGVGAGMFGRIASRVARRNERMEGEIRNNFV